MARKRLNAEQIVTKLRQIEVLQAQGKTIAVACKDAGTTEQSYYRWRNEYGGLGVDQATCAQCTASRPGGDTGNISKSLSAVIAP